MKDLDKPGTETQQGSVLVMALIVLAALSIMIISFSTDVDLDLQISRNLQLQNQAFNNAETGLALSLEALRHSMVCSYLDGAAQAAASQLKLEPDYELQINPDLGSLYEQGGSIQVLQQGSLAARVDIQPRNHAQADRKWFTLSAIGKQQGSESVINLQVEQEDTTLNLQSPLSLFHQDPELVLKGNSFVSGKNHQVPDDFSQSTGFEANFAQGQEKGEKLPLYAEEHMEEQDIDTRGAPEKLEDFDYQSLLDSIGSSAMDNQDWLKQAQYFESIANELLQGPEGEMVQDASQELDNLGTRKSPEITVVQDLDLSSVNGAGILILKDGARITGNVHYEGLVISSIESQEFELFSGGTNTIFGGLVVLQTDPDLEFDQPVELAGTPSILYSQQGLRSAMAAYAKNAPLERISWRSK